MEKRKMKKEKKRKKIKYEPVLQWCGGVGAMWGTWTHRPSLARMARDERPRNWRLTTLVDRTPQKLKGEREYHEIQKRKLLGIVGN